MQNDKVLSLLGLAQKAGKIKSGAFATEDAVKSYKAWLVIVATDASANTKKKFSDMTYFYEVPFWEYGTKDSLGHFTGKEERSCLAVCDEGFANSLDKLRKSLCN